MSAPTATGATARYDEIDFDLHWGFAIVKGTRAALTAEGLIPAGLAWPVGVATAEWQAGGTTYTLCRVRPAWHVGGRASWREIDYFALRSDRFGDAVQRCHDRRGAIVGAALQQQTLAAEQLRRLAKEARADAALQACLAMPRSTDE